MLFFIIGLMMIGLIGIFTPGLPGNGLIFLSALGYGIMTRFEKISIMMILLFAGLTILSILFDYAGGLVGAKKYGASKWGMIGGVLGGIIGFLILAIPGLLIGQFIGTLGGELYYGKNLETSFKAGIGSMIGYILSVIFQITIGLFMIVLFLLRVFT